MATAPPRWAGQTMARAGGARFPDGNAGGPGSGIRREFQRAGAALPGPVLKAAEGSRIPLALAAEGCRPMVPRDASNLDIFQMEMEIGGVDGEPDALSECFSAVSDACSEASNDTNVMNVLEDFIGQGNDLGASSGLEPAKATAAGRLFRNESGHLPKTRSAVGDGFINAKPFGNVRRSLSGHQPKAGRLGDQAQFKVNMVPQPRQLVQRKDWSLQSWLAKAHEASWQELPQNQGVKSTPVPISYQFCRKVTAPVVDDDSPFMPPHEYLSLRELSEDPDKVALANPSTGRLKGLSSLRMRNIVLQETGYYDGYTEMWQQPKRFSTMPTHPNPDPRLDCYA